MAKYNGIVIQRKLKNNDVKGSQITRNLINTIIYTKRNIF